jgi:penicillin-binding protein 1B
MFLSKRKVRLLALFVFVLLTVEVASLTVGYYVARDYLIKHDPRKSAGSAGMMVFARPRILRVRQAVSQNDVISHLTNIGYLERAGDGGFRVDGSNLHIFARFPEFKSAVISFKGRSIESINVEGQRVDQVEIEPIPLASFVRLIRDDVARRMRIRRIILQPVDLVPSTLYDAIRASEDHRFESHNGIDGLGTMRAIFSGGGGSTITQQMIKNVVLKDQSRNVERKMKEAMLAFAVERMLTKEEIITAYANNCYLGHIVGGSSVYGFAAAAQELFGVADVKKLSLAQAATLAGLLDKPEFYLKAARSGNYKPVLDRRTRVLKLMHKCFPDLYSDEVIAHADAEPMKFLFASEEDGDHPLDIMSNTFQRYAAEQAERLVGEGFDSSNLRIYTTIDPDLQAAAHEAVTRHLTRLDPLVESARRRTPSHSGSRIQSALVAIDARTGEILAMIGGRDDHFNRALARRSPASVVKPFVYLKAIERGWHNGPFNAATIIDPKRDQVDNFRPSRHVGGPARVRVHLARSDNGAAVVAARCAGLAEVRDFLGRMTGGYSEELTGMLAIGGAAGCETTPLNIASAYSIFSSNGIKATETPFAAVYRNGEKIEYSRIAPIRVSDPAATYIVTQMMRSVVGVGADGEVGTARSTLRLAGLDADIEMAGKTGTGEVSDFWFVGLTPRLVVAVWVGMDDNMELKMEYGFDGNRVALPIWAEFMRAVSQHRSDLLRGHFERPVEVRSLRIDRNQGCVRADGIEEYFIRGREPAPCGVK